MDISDIGPFKKITAPPQWQRRTLKLPQANRSELPVLQLVLPGKEEELEIGIFYRGKLETEEDGENFHALLEQYQYVDSPVSLSPGQIRSLSRILALAGFNQYSFPRHLTGYNPDFTLKTAQVFLLNGKPVLKVDGEFKADTEADMHFGCIYVEADTKGRKVYELYVQATNRDVYLRALPSFKMITDSIVWAENSG